MVFPAIKDPDYEGQVERRPPRIPFSGVPDAGLFRNLLSPDAGSGKKGRVGIKYLRRDPRLRGSLFFIAIFLFRTRV
jgi:hypothetical protein